MARRERGQHGYRARCYAERRCILCHQPFTPRSGNATKCDQCGDPRHRSHLPPRPKRLPQERRAILGPDFEAQFPALKAELDRQCATNGHGCHLYLIPHDPTSFGPTRRRVE